MAYFNEYIKLDSPWKCIKSYSKKWKKIWKYISTEIIQKQSLLNVGLL